MRIGILGAPGSGKTTVFNVLARARAEVGGFHSANAEPNLAVVKVPDERLDRLTAMFNPRREVPAEVTYVDVAGVVRGAGKDGSTAILAQLRTTDMLLHVVRAFDSPMLGMAEPLDELSTVQLELLLADLDVVQKRHERLQKEVQLGKGTPNERQARALELELFERLKAALEQERPIRDLELSDADRRAIKTYALLTARPLLVLMNVQEAGDQADRLVAGASAICQHEDTGVTSLAGKLEMELAELEPEEAAEFMADLGIEELGLNRVIQLSYRLSRLIAFFTVGDDECRAWPIPAGSNAVDAARAIHSDLARGFIRAEVISYDDLVARGSLAEGRKQGVLRSEGKAYQVKDGDVLNILFNI
ncbi:MAG: redox-regulated ATPase YchF [Chloroflexi bacterium]|nr:redox-regulated ATPase YchF [Chloroflexota bacterium]